MEWLIWLLIVILVIVNIALGILSIILVKNYSDCKDNQSPYCPQYICPNGTEPITYQDCVNSTQCAAGLTPPCSIAATSS